MTTMLRVVGVLALSAATAMAQPASTQAESLFRHGKALMQEKKLAEACIAFEGSYKLDPSTTTLLNHADCREKNGQLATAWGLFVDAQRVTRGSTDASAKAMNTTAMTRASKLEPRLSKLSVRVTEERTQQEVLLNGVLVDKTTWNLALPIDGGTYTLVSRAPGHKEWTGVVTIKPERDQQTVDVPALDPLPVAIPTEGEPITKAVPLEPPPSLIQPQPRSRALPIALGVGALALGGTAVGFAIWGDSIYDDATREPDDARQESLWKSANQRRYAAVGFAGAGVACAGAAVFLLLRGRGDESPRRTAHRGVEVEPVASAELVGVSLRGGW
ncbi:MAG: hypothetical protein SFX73_38335 [Kofleriaceae bacterium]|nr:hypothetical protein [Kofleriaceae bacterium]